MQDASADELDFDGSKISHGQRKYVRAIIKNKASQNTMKKQLKIFNNCDIHSR
jgi:hypothetical protein